jgi:hypothetical protein
VATSRPSIAARGGGKFSVFAMMRTTRPCRSSRSIVDPFAQSASNCGNGVGMVRRPMRRVLSPALCALRTSINAQRLSLDSALPKAGIATAPDGAVMPCEMYQNRSPSVCARKCGAVRSAGRTGPVVTSRLVRRPAHRPHGIRRSLPRTRQRRAR